MLVLKDGELFDDGRSLVADDAALPAIGAVLPLARWLAEDGAEAGHGVVLEATDDPERAWPALARATLVAVHFSRFADGRGYSQARLLRSFGYGGELRAIGSFGGRDQAFFLARCGFDSYAVADAAAAAELATGFGDFSAVYQPAADGRRRIGLLRAP